ncbi:MAG: replicative DNA helicase [Oleispira sp.]|nr:replicative DNA helicase [Oleispira sp.]
MNMEVSRRSLFSADAEISVLGSLLLDAEAFSEVVEVGVTPKSFYDFRHAAIFSVVSSMYEASMPVDVVTVFQHLEAIGEADQVGGMAYLGDLAYAVPSAANVGGYAKILRSLEFERLWYQSAKDIEEVLVSTECDDHADRMGRIQMILNGAERVEREGNIVEFKPALKQYLEVVDERSRSPELDGILTGFEFIDRRFGGMKPGWFGVIGARPAMGKTAYAMNIIKHVALKQCKNAMVFSLEMSTDELVERMVAAEAKVKLGLLKSGKVMTHEESMTRFGAAMTNMSKSGGQIFFDDTAGLNITTLVARAKRYHRKHGLGLILVDHVALVETSLKNEDENAKITLVSRLLKKLAKELGCVVIALSQLNRGVEKRPNKRPVMSDLKSSGALEQDADWIQFLYRDDYYNEDSLTPGQAEIITDKNRHGPIGTDYFGWRGEYSLFEGLKEGDRYESPREEKENFV